ncbi:CBS domain containing protein [Acanthamoeba castellanii str. Neff]|uniref:CBS domain containing protein n=1 Tax=Acanthamoeba castellanii (strain ATCC 30010 / Neff) TaxID=1257118 RepID=L8HB64_ACACF|nr:CBS domain containing protein [Acanthamoeba castellanii str. Neff]ELR21973.1 CBS domain containing protein [Acanthamoeba castellanii str. Neff]
METATVRDVLSHQQLPAQIHVVSKTATVKEVLDTLYRHHILAAPVVDFESKCEGLIDVLDVLSFLLQVASEPVESRVSPLSTTLHNDDMDMLVQRSERFNTTNVATGVNLSTRNPFLPCTLGAPLIEVLRNFARGVHRVPVVDSEDPTRIVAMLTQTDANRFLATDPEKYLGQARAHASITDLGLVAGADKVVTVPTSTKAIDAFITMHAKGLSALAVVDAEGAFQGCLSATDLKLITDYRFQALLLPVVEFLEHVRKEEGRTCKSYRVWCIPTTPLQTVVKKLAEERVHRVFVVDPVSMKPLGVVSLTDIARIVTAKA